MTPELKSLAALLSPNAIQTDSETIQTYGRDWLKKFTPNAKAVIFPQSTKDVAAIVQWARKNKTALVPSGGRTGLSGGAVALNGEVVVSLHKMNKIEEPNLVEGTIHVQAGAITEALQQKAKDVGLYFPVDFASRGSSQIGGNIATNAGGTKVIRYGLIRDWVLSLTVVDGTGNILELNSDLIKNNAGYDLKQLFIGSEGTLGIITEATLRLTRPPQNLVVLLLAAKSLQVSSEILQKFRSKINLTAFEFFTDKALAYVLKHADVPDPFSARHPVYYVVEFENLNESDLDAALNVFEELQNTGLISDGVMSQNDQQLELFWKYREDVSEALAASKPWKSDISVQISRMAEFVDKTDQLLKTKYAGLECVWFGHIGDGNLHINVINSTKLSESEFAKKCDDLAQELFTQLQNFKGSVSAEHGIGLTKKPYLHFSRSAIEIERMKLLKKVFDPDCIMNPGKIFDY